MKDVLRICREHGQPRTWWQGLPRREWALLVADLRERTGG